MDFVMQSTPKGPSRLFTCERGYETMSAQYTSHRDAQKHIICLKGPVETGLE